MADTSNRLKQLEEANRLNRKEIELLQKQIEKLQSEHKKDLEEIVQKLAKSTRYHNALYECFLIALVVMVTVTLAYAFSFSYHQTFQSVPNYPLNRNLSSIRLSLDQQASQFLTNLDWSRLNSLIDTANEKLGQCSRFLFSFFYDN